jgi:phage-related protein
MVMQTFTPPVTPDQASEVTLEPRIITLSFNDGYEQDMPDGINNLQAQLSPKWTNARKTEADAILAFLSSVAKTREPFWWVPNGETAPIAVKCLRLTKSWKKGRYCDITAEFKETAARA